MDIRTMQRSLTLQWIGRLEYYSEEEEDKRPGWYNLVLEILQRSSQVSYTDMVEFPWRQMWGERNKALPPSVAVFWNEWKKHRQYPLHPTTSEELAATSFWFHPSLKGIETARWNYPCWRDMLQGNGIKAPVLTVADLVAVAKGVPWGQTRDMKAAAERLIANFPIEWKALLGDLSTIKRADFKRSFSRIYCPLHEHPYRELNIPWDNKDIYNFLLPEVHRKKGRPARDNLAAFRKLCARNRVSIEGIDPRKIWLNTRTKRADYPKFSDLYFSLIHGTVTTGKDWMYNNGMCPHCNILQSAEHLFWLCPLAKEVWERLKLYWEQITRKKIAWFPKTWPELLISDIILGKRLKIGAKQRWRLLWSMGIWALWTQRCQWSFEEIPNMTQQGVMASYEDRVRRLYMSERQVVLDRDRTKLATLFSKKWGHDARTKKLPPWI